MWSHVWNVRGISNGIKRKIKKTLADGPKTGPTAQKNMTNDGLAPVIIIICRVIMWRTAYSALCVGKIFTFFFLNFRWPSGRRISRTNLIWTLGEGKEIFAGPLFCGDRRKIPTVWFFASVRIFSAPVRRPGFLFRTDVINQSIKYHTSYAYVRRPPVVIHNSSRCRGDGLGGRSDRFTCSQTRRPANISDLCSVYKSYL